MIFRDINRRNEVSDLYVYGVHGMTADVVLVIPTLSYEDIGITPTCIKICSYHVLTGTRNRRLQRDSTRTDMTEKMEAKCKHVQTVKQLPTNSAI